MKLSITLTAAALLSSTVLAQQAGQPPAATPEAATQPPPATPSVDVAAIFDKLDADHDGKLTQDEAQVHPTVASHFANADTNHDGVVTKDEFLAAFRPAQ